MKFKNKSFHDCTELFQRFQGQPVWIAGSDPTLGDYPDGFFNEKKSITLHLAHVKFPRATFRYSSEYDRSKYLISKDSSYAKLPLIAAYPMYGVSRRTTTELLSNCEEVYFHRMMSYPPNGVRGEIDEQFTRFKIRQTLRNKARIWGGHGTCLHTCIYMALLTGASEIHIIGCGHNLASDGSGEHFGAVETDHHEMRPGYRSFTDPVENAPLIEQTRLFAKLCEESGIPFFWHRRYTPEMNDLIAVSDEWLENQKRLAKRKFPIIKKLYRALVKRPYNQIMSRF